MDLIKQASVGLAKRSSRRGIIGRAGKAALGVAMVGTGGRMLTASPAAAAGLDADVWDNAEAAMEAAIAAESAAWVAAGQNGCCFCWTNCNACRPGYMAKIYDCPCSGNPGSQQHRVRIVCTNRCCGPGAC